LTAKKAKEHARTHAPAQPLKTAAKSGLKLWQTDLLACVGIFLAVFILFHEIPLQSRSFSRGDDSESAAATSLFAQNEAKVRDYPMWDPYVFGGFPGLAAGQYFNYEHFGLPYALAYKYLSPRYWAEWLTVNVTFLGFGNDRSDNGRPLIAYLLFGGLLTFLLLRRLGFDAWIAVFGSLIMAWNPYLISLATAAHGGKLLTFVYMPLILLCAWNVMTKRRFYDFALLALAFGWQIAVGGHTQILFYSFVMVGLVYLVWAISELRTHPSVLVLKPAALIAAALVLGFAVGAVWYVPLLKYLGYSIRGMGPALAAAGTQAGYSLADATMWSFAPSELITFVVPSWFGLKSPYYWGDMPFTSSSFYFGVVPLLFAVLAFWGKKDRLFWSLFVVSVFSILLSFGKHFEAFYALFFDLLPFFNKFRTPSLILLLAVFCGIVFAGYGIRFLLSLHNTEKWRKIFLVGMIGCAALLLIVLAAGDSLASSFGSFVKSGEEAHYSPEQLVQIRAMRFGLLRTDLLLALLWLALASALCWLKVRGRIKPAMFLSGILLITVVDLARFSTQFFDPQPAGSAIASLEPSRVVRTLKQDTTTFRVMPVGRLMQDNRWAYWNIASLGGYHGAKMRSYQDLVDNVFFSGPDRRIPLNMPFFSAMNCKYLLAESPLPPLLNLEPVAEDAAAKHYLYRNPRALDRAYFVDSVYIITDRAETIRRLTDPGFLWDYMAVVDRPLPERSIPHPDKTAVVTEYIPHYVRIHASVPVPSFMVFSDAYYAPGWSATDNGRETEIYQVNGFVRGLFLKAGEHTIEFRYTGKSEHLGRNLATVTHFLVWGFVIGGWFWLRRRRKAEAQ